MAARLPRGSGARLRTQVIPGENNAPVQYPGAQGFVPGFQDGLGRLRVGRCRCCRHRRRPLHGLQGRGPGANGYAYRAGNGRSSNEATSAVMHMNMVARPWLKKWSPRKPFAADPIRQGVLDMRINTLRSLIGLSAALLLGPLTAAQAQSPGIYLG